MAFRSKKQRMPSSIPTLYIPLLAKGMPMGGKH